MASVFQRGRSDIWMGTFRAWDAAQGKWRWIQKSTGVRDRNAASAIVATWERATSQAKAGVLTKARAMEMVNDIMRLAGLETISAAPTMRQHIEAMHDAKKVSPGTARKQAGWLKSLATWAGERINTPVEPQRHHGQRSPAMALGSLSPRGGARAPPRQPR